MEFRNALLAATLLAIPVAAGAQPITGLYIGAGAGANVMLQEHATTGGVFPSGTRDMNTHFGPAGEMSLGYGLGNGLRAEIEGFVMENDVNAFTGATTAGGHELKYGGMGNVLYDFVGLTPYVQPYIGAGVGYMEEQLSNLRFVAPGGAEVTSGTHSKGGFAWQGIIGAAFPVSPALSLTVDYRFMGLTGNRNYPVTATAGAVSVPGTLRVSNDYNNMVLVGLTYAFGAAPPPAPPAPAPVAPSPISRSYLVFFDWDKADLTDRARQIVSEAAANSTKVQYTQLEVNGYTDTSGTARYNQGLSVRRAKAVAAELVKDGVPASAIAIQGFGETHLLVPTGPGVREPQNRRVEIIIK
ncbi:MAG TPA: OmpA family protein [Rhodopila sp.]|jgi:outer membrane protein OmpA-like peptidoglycan-associated protein